MFLMISHVSTFAFILKKTRCYLLEKCIFLRCGILYLFKGDL